MFWRKIKTPEDKKLEMPKKATTPKKIDGPLWGYMATQRGVVTDVLHHLRLVERDGTAGGKPATMVRIFDPAAAEKEGVLIDGYENLDGHRKLILYEGYYRGPEMAAIHVDRVAHDEEKV